MRKADRAHGQAGGLAASRAVASSTTPSPPTFWFVAAVCTFGPAAFCAAPVSFCSIVEIRLIFPPNGPMLAGTCTGDVIILSIPPHVQPPLTSRYQRWPGFVVLGQAITPREH